MLENNKGQTGNLHTDSRLMEFRLGKERFALPLLDVREVVAPGNVTPVPQSPAYFLGIMNLRGLIVSIVDLRKKIGVAAASGSENAVVICSLGGIAIGFLVDAVVAVVTPNAEELSDASSIQGQRNDHYLTGVYRQKDGIVLLVDPTKLVDTTDRKFINGLQKTA